jgi:hypothetical protein
MTSTSSQHVVPTIRKANASYELLTITEYAHVQGCDPTTVRRRIRKGTLKEQFILLPRLGLQHHYRIKWNIEKEGDNHDLWV